MKTSEVNRETENHTEVKPSKADFEKTKTLFFVVASINVPKNLNRL